MSDAPLFRLHAPGLDARPEVRAWLDLVTERIMAQQGAAIEMMIQAGAAAWAAHMGQTSCVAPPGLIERDPWTLDAPRTVQFVCTGCDAVLGTVTIPPPA